MVGSGKRKRTPASSNYQVKRGRQGSSRSSAIAGHERIETHEDIHRDVTDFVMDLVQWEARRDPLGWFDGIPVEDIPKIPRKVVRALKANPGPIRNGADCALVPGFEPGMCQIIDHLKTFVHDHPKSHCATNCSLGDTFRQIVRASLVAFGTALETRLWKACADTIYSFPEEITHVDQLWSDPSFSQITLALVDEHLAFSELMSKRGMSEECIQIIRSFVSQSALWRICTTSPPRLTQRWGCAANVPLAMFLRERVEKAYKENWKECYQSTIHAYHEVIKVSHEVTSVDHLKHLNLGKDVEELVNCFLQSSEVVAHTHKKPSARIV